MALRTGELPVASGILFLADASDLFTRDEWTKILIASSQGSENAQRAILEAVSAKLGKEKVPPGFLVLQLKASGPLPIFQDKETLTVFLRGVGIKDL